MKVVRDRDTLDLLHIPACVAAVVRTSDGFFLAQDTGDCGFNRFLGKPSFHDGPGKRLMQQKFRVMSYSRKRRVVFWLRYLGFVPSEVLR